MKNRFVKYLLPLLLIYAFELHGEEGNDSISTFNPKRVKIAAVALGTTYVASMTGLYQLWYKDYPSSRFHYFDDQYEWKRMDKMGHIGTAYYVSRWCNDIVTWTGAKRNNSALIGTGVSYLFLTTIEFFDAYSTNWGFSVSDMVANTTGCGLFLGQQLLWKEQRMQIKFSYVPTKYPDYRPDDLGKTDIEKLFKDYNGQTYWLSFNIHSFLNKDSRFPKWLNFAFGYGADGMVTAYEQAFEIKHVIFPLEGRVREYYISPDIDLTKINVHSKLFHAFAKTFGFIKFPLPAIKWRDRGRPEFKTFGF